MNHLDPRIFNGLIPADPPEVIEAKMKRLEEKRARDFDKFLADIERTAK